MFGITYFSYKKNERDKMIFFNGDYFDFLQRIRNVKFFSSTKTKIRRARNLLVVEAKSFA